MFSRHPWVTYAELKRTTFEHWLSRPQVEQLMTWFVILRKSSKLYSYQVASCWHDGAKNDFEWLYNFYANQPFLSVGRIDVSKDR